ncbi:hypothetical protein AB0D38_14085 [Streptomyces sp. NPDC048279]|uniref:hypothetical protein n=1 Tax=Streptomyces sp. NPDC048279 TaxID=3154714 RepID=UPI003414E78E
MLVAAVDRPFAPDTVVRGVLARGPPHRERLAGVFPKTWKQDGRPDTAPPLMQAACEYPEAATLVGELSRGRVVSPIVVAIAPEQAGLKAS